MCGICGLLNLDGAPARKRPVEGMTLALEHRGPDGHGLHFDGPIGLGHRRLSIIDLTAAAAQPMTSSDNRYAITYNGEVYNYEELRNELEKMGFAFSSTGDTEVVLKAYIAWGEQCLHRFNGMFAFAIWDATKAELFLARDRYGIKPLYTHHTGSSFAFASEGKAFFSLPSFSPEVDVEALAEYFTYQNIFSDRTMLKGVRTFPAGSCQTVPLNKGPGAIRQFWDFSYDEPEHLPDERECAEELDRLFTQAVKRCMVGDVEIGAFLSSGMDSGSIAAVASGFAPGLQTFTCGFNTENASDMERAFDERKQAARHARHLNTRHLETCLSSKDMEASIDKLVWHLDEPRVGQSYPNFFAAKLAASKVKVVLAGTGGDEIFGGYPWRYYRTLQCGTFDAYVEKYYHFWQRLVPNDTLPELLSPVWNKACHVSPEEIFRSVYKQSHRTLNSPEDCINHSLYLESKTFLHGLLMVEDKLGMAFGLETRFPFLDNDLVDFATKVPARFKVRNIEKIIRMNENESGPKSDKFFMRTNDGKLLLRRAMARHIPTEVANGIKQGFSGPDATWFRKESAQFIRDIVSAGDSAIHEFLNPHIMAQLTEEHISGKENRRLLIWSFVCFESWCRNFLIGESSFPMASNY